MRKLCPIPDEQKVIKTDSWTNNPRIRKISVEQVSDLGNEVINSWTNLLEVMNRRPKCDK